MPYEKIYIDYNLYETEEQRDKRVAEEERIAEEEWEERKKTERKTYERLKKKYGE